MSLKAFLIVTALGEGGTGALLLGAPGLVLSLLLGVDGASSEAHVAGRVAGAALVTVAASCWPARTVGLAVLAGVLFYDVAAAVLLAHAATVLHMTGPALWPAVALHAGLGAWCLVELLRARAPGAGRRAQATNANP